MNLDLGNMQISLTQLKETLRDVVNFGDRETGNIIVAFGDANKAVGRDKPEGNMFNRVFDADGPVDVRVSVNVGVLDSANRGGYEAKIFSGRITNLHGFQPNNGLRSMRLAISRTHRSCVERFRFPEVPVAYAETTGPLSGPVFSLLRGE